jgi:pathogenesis-related protein 1
VRSTIVRALLALAAVTAAGQSSISQEMLAAHNAVRAKVSLPPLSWSDKLASAAQEWANTLIEKKEFLHRPKSKTGENLYEVEGAKSSPKQVVERWASESSNYDYKSNRCHGVCGHYTQIVWRDTKEVGCAVGRGGAREVWVCEYSPPGNYVGHRPY